MNKLIETNVEIVKKTIVIKSEELILTNQRALFWEQESALVLSDLHLGKTAHFRKNGIALPVDLIQEDLRRLSDLILHFKPQRIIVVGDFLHAGKNSEFELFKDFKGQFPELHIILVKGNHDRISEQHLLELGVSEIHNIYKKRHIVFSHENIESTTQFVISGHLHPGISLKSSIRKYLKFPCYIKTDNQLILPAFSSFTGLDTKNHPENSTYYFFSEEGIYEL